METGTLTLTDFLLARIDDDEQAARDVLTWPKSVQGFGARRRLREAEAKRWILTEHEGAHNCTTYIDEDDNRDCLTLRALGSVFADHPDYRDEWRP